MLASFGLTHMIVGGIFGWWCVLGAILPDLIGLVGWWNVWRRKASLWSWFIQMPPWAQMTFGWMHTLTVVGALFVLAFALSFFISVAWLVMIAFGMLTHNVLDLFFHEGSPARLIHPNLIGDFFGVEWYRFPLYWPDQLIVGVVVGLHYFAGLNNSILEIL
jgi:hypothetical protein